MPFRSKAQQRWMFATNPEMARRWAHETDDIKGLPDKVRKAKKKRKKAAADATAQLREAGQSIYEPRGGRGEYAAESGEELQRFATLLGFSDKRASLSMGSGAHEGSLMDIYEASGAGGRVLSSPLTPVQASGTCMHGGSGMDLSALVKVAYGMMQQNPQNASGPSPPASGVVNPISATGYAKSPEMTEMWRQQMLNMSGGGKAPPMRGMQLGAQSMHGTADTLGSPIATGKLGNGPGVGFSGAGTQMNFGGVAEKMAELQKVADPQLNLPNNFFTDAYRGSDAPVLREAASDARAKAYEANDRFTTARGGSEADAAWADRVDRIRGANRLTSQYDQAYASPGKPQHPFPRPQLPATPIPMAKTPSTPREPQPPAQPPSTQHPFPRPEMPAEPIPMAHKGPAAPVAAAPVPPAAPAQAGEWLPDNFHEQEANRYMQERDALQGDLTNANAQAASASGWLNNPRLWAGLGIGAAGMYGGKKLYDWWNQPDEEKEKAAAWQDDLFQLYQNNPEAITGTVGALGGAGLGAMMAPKGKRLQRGLMGGLVGGLGGAAGGYGVNQIPGQADMPDGMRDYLLGSAAGLGAVGGGVVPNWGDDEEKLAAAPFANPQLAQYLESMYDQPVDRDTSTGHMDELDQIELLMELEDMTGKNVPDDAAFLKHKMPPWYKPWGQREWERFPNYGAIDDYMTSLQQPQKAAAEDSHSDPLASVAGGGYRDVLAEHVTQDQILQAGRKLCKSGGATPKRKVIRVVDAKLAAANDLRVGKPRGTHGEVPLLRHSQDACSTADRVTANSLLKAAFNLGMARLDHGGGGGAAPLKPAQPAQPPQAAGPQSPAKPMTSAKPQAPSAGPVPRPIDSLPFELRTSSPVSDEERYYKSLMRYKEQLQAPKAQLAGPSGSPSLK